MHTHGWRIRMRYTNQGILSGYWFCGLAKQAHNRTTVLTLLY